tara:strand:+ start:418 stop:855 length:438 start_codon:yes stop_codon:yes gene_type:complete
LSLLDTIAPKRGPKHNRYNKVFFAKSIFYVSVAFYGVFVLIANIFWDEPTLIEVIPATRTTAEIELPLKEYLSATNVRGLNGFPPVVNCGDLFNDIEFDYEYLNRGSWRANAYYELVRYHWRIDDLSLEVTRDPWVKTTRSTVKC